MDKEHLKWVRKDRQERQNDIASPEASGPDAYFEKREHIYQLAKMNPFIPIGLVCMWGALGKGITAFIRGDTARSNKMMRYRVLFHALTLLSVVGGSVVASYAVEYHSPNEEVPQWQKNAVETNL